MAVGAYALTTLANVKAYLHISGDESDTLLEGLIDAVSALFETYTNRKLAARDYDPDSDPEDALLDGNGELELVLPQYPVNSITEILVNEQEIPASASYSESGWMDDSRLRKAGILRLRNYVFSAGRGNVAVTYNAGYSTIPDDLAQACIEQVAWKFRESSKRELGMQSHTLKDGSVTFYPTDLLPAVKKLLEPYRRRALL